MKLIILDRDGTINHDSDHYIKSPEEWRPITGSLEAIARLTQAGYRIAVATNQSGIARGLFDMRTLNAIHDTLQPRARPGRRAHRRVLLLPARRRPAAPAASRSRACCSRSRGASTCRSTTCDMVGDALRDLEAAAAAGAKPVLVLTGKGAKTQDEGGLPPGTRVFPDLGGVRRAPRAMTLLRSRLFALALLAGHPALRAVRARHLCRCRA